MRASAQGFVPLTLKDISSGDHEIQIQLSTGRRLKGTVLDQQGRPVPHAQLALWLGATVKHRFEKGSIPLSLSVPAYRRTSDDNGEFEFDNLGTGAFGLLVQKGGHAPGVVLGELRQDSEVIRVELNLKFGSVLSGSVTAMDGSPVPGALVTLSPGDKPNDAQIARRARTSIAIEQRCSKKADGRSLRIGGN